MKHLKEFMSYLEGRSGSEFKAGLYFPTGGGLRALEDMCQEDNHPDTNWYRAKRIELELTMDELRKIIKES